MTQEQFATRSAFARPDLRLFEESSRLGGRMALDYDYSKSDPVARLLDPRNHGTDLGKLPWHPTFSNQSAFANPRYPGGQWGRDFMGNTFTPSARQTKDPRYLREYMREQEPNVRLTK